MTNDDQSFYDKHATGSTSSAGRVVPYLLSLFKPRSVVDVGCGIGTSAAEFARRGVPEVIGVDGAYVGTTRLINHPSAFLPRDLEQWGSYRNSLSAAQEFQSI